MTRIRKRPWARNSLVRAGQELRADVQDCLVPEEVEDVLPYHVDSFPDFHLDGSVAMDRRLQRASASARRSTISVSPIEG